MQIRNDYSEFSNWRRLRSIIQKGIDEKTEALHTNYRELEASYVEEKNRNQDLIDSMYYARLIQQALLPPNSRFKEVFPESFIIYEPKELIGGDFYWVYSDDEADYVAVGDCVGHGVPGAMLSVLNSSLLNDIVGQKGLRSPNEILAELDRTLVDLFSMNQSTSHVSDSVDIILCRYERSTQILEFSGAKRPLIVIRNQEVLKYNGDRFSVAGWQAEKHRDYHLQAIQLHHGDGIFLFSDGVTDQFGGPNGKKLNTNRWNQLLLTVSTLTGVRQEEILREAITRWMGNQEQVDDITVIGMSF